MTAVELFHTELGSVGAHSVLLVHGWGGDGREWSAHAETLSTRHHVIVPDLRGHGRSPAPAHDNTPLAMARDLSALVHQLDIGPVVAVGHSMGGQVVNLLAVHHPDSVRSVIALDPAHGAPETELPDMRRNLTLYQAGGAEAAAAFVAGAFAEDAPPGLRTAHVRTMLGTPGHVVAQSYAGMYLDPGAAGPRPAAEDYLRRRTQPALTVWTAQPYADWERGTLHVPGSRVDHWPDSGHYLHEEHTDRTVELIEGWIARSSGRCPARRPHRCASVPDAQRIP
ncbi:alpha/beta fold hydrolase [Streptomyces sp. NPDC050535]|uniref:alpha/beta fold hydrolase n=1 Tax=Streptomyces sp. NPDC050535 TaxID=3365626 RepID=UPI0037986EA4